MINSYKLFYKAIIVSLDEVQYKIATKNGALPEIEVNGIAPSTWISNLVNLDDKWLDTKIVDINVDKNLIIAYYTCMVPEAIEIPEIEWSNLGDIDNNDKINQEMVKKALETNIR